MSFLIAFLILLLVLIYEVFILKKRLRFIWIPAVVAGILVLQFLGVRARFRFFLPRKPHLFILADASKSVPRASVQKLVSNLPRGVKLYWFANRISTNSEDLNPRITRLWSAVNIIARKMRTGDILTVISDFRDFYDTRQFFTNIQVPLHAVLVERQAGDKLGIEKVDLPEQLPSGEMVTGKLRVQSATNGKAFLKIWSGNRLLIRKKVELKAGSQNLNFKFLLKGKRKKLLKFNIQSDWDSYPGNNTTTYLVNLNPNRISVLLLGGRPSADFARMNRFLHSLRWMKVHAVVLKSPHQTFDLSRISHYRGVVLMDLSRRQVRNLSVLKSKRIPMVYIPGLRQRNEVLFSDEWEVRKSFRDSVQDIELPVLLTSDVVEKDVENRHMVFVWKTVFWDMQASALGLEGEDYETFWKSKVAYLLPDDSPITKPLNFLVGTKVKGVEITAGWSSIQKVNGVSAYPENALLSGNEVLARNLDAHYFKNPQSVNWKKRLPRRQKTIRESYLFQQNLLFFPFLYIFLGTLLLLNWFLESRQKLH